MRNVSLSEFYPTLPFDLRFVPTDMDDPFFAQIHDLVFDHFYIKKDIFMQDIDPGHKFVTRAGAAAIGDCVVGGIIYTSPAKVANVKMVGQITYLVARKATIRGVGLALAAACENDLFGSEVRRIELDADAGAISFWENRGFQGSIADACNMSKMLNPTNLIDPDVHFSV